MANMSSVSINKQADDQFKKLTRTEDGRQGPTEYEVRADAITAKIARLKALRLERDAVILAAPPARAGEEGRQEEENTRHNFGRVKTPCWRAYRPAPYQRKPARPCPPVSKNFFDMSASPASRHSDKAPPKLANPVDWFFKNRLRLLSRARRKRASRARSAPRSRGALCVRVLSDHVKQPSRKRREAERR